VPASMIWSRERILREGEVFKFRTAPVDPYDAFRGRYVALQLEPRQVALPEGLEVRRGQTVHARLGVGSDGCATFGGVSLTPPDDAAYWTVRAGWNSGPGTLHLDLPIDRYYMEEKLAPRAEAAYRDNSRRGAQNSFVTVRLLRGKAVLENLWIGDESIDRYLQQREEQP